MIKPNAILAAVAAVFCFASPLFADGSAFATEDRKEMIDASRRETITLAAKEVPASSLGEWKDIVESTAFLLMRRAEIFRGEMRILALDNAIPSVRIYPDGTLAVSTGLMDFIDASLFDEAASSPRRMRNFDSEREAMLAPFIAFEAARFALDQPFRSWTATAVAGYDKPFEERVAPTADDVFAADSLAPAILDAAGLNAEVYAEWLLSLQRLAAGNADYAPLIARYTDTGPSIAKRLDALKKRAEHADSVSSHLALILASLSSVSGLDDAATSAASLIEDKPDAWWFRRLDAIVAHVRWIESVPSAERALIAEFPYASDDKIARKSDESAKALPGSAAQLSKVPGDQKLWLSALESYKTALAIRSESGLLSSGAMLLVWSGNSTLREKAITDAKAAFEAERASTSQVARINLASVLYLTDRDRTLARAAIDEAVLKSRSFQDTDKASPQAAYAHVPEGFPGDGRDAMINGAIILYGFGDREKSSVLLKEVAALHRANGVSSNMEFRKARLGDTADTLLAKWGKPAEILSVYPDEWWVYPSLAAKVLLSETKKGGSLAIRSITLKTGSAISFAGERRVGDPLRDFASGAIQPVYRANDSEVYFLNDTALSLFTLSGKIRGVRAGL